MRDGARQSGTAVRTQEDHTADLCYPTRNGAEMITSVPVNEESLRQAVQRLAEVTARLRSCGNTPGFTFLLSLNFFRVFHRKEKVTKCVVVRRLII